MDPATSGRLFHRRTADLFHLPFFVSRAALAWPLVLDGLPAALNHKGQRRGTLDLRVAFRSLPLQLDVSLERTWSSSIYGLMV